MVTLEKELLPGFEWELDFSCSRCGSTRAALIFDKENEKMYCAACLLVIHSLPEAPLRRPEKTAAEKPDFQLDLADD